MNRYLRARMLTPDREHEEHRTHDRREEYDAEDRFRDRDGREHYNDGRFAPMEESGMWVDDRGGRYVPARGDHQLTGMHYPPMMPPYYPSPIFESGEARMRPIGKIGFSIGGEAEPIPQELRHDYRTTAGYPSMDEMSHHQGDGYHMGRGRATVYPIFDRQTAEEWMAGLQNEDGSTGPHWTMERIQQEITQRGIKCDLVKFWAVINAIYSDDVAVAKKHGVNTMDYYIDRAKAWLDDKDAVEDKAAAYYHYVVKH